MIHYTCDLCARDLDADEARYVVKIEAFASCDPAELTEADLDKDHMEEVSELIQEMEENGEIAELPTTSKEFRHDLCGECFQRFLRDPLGREQTHKVLFSKN